MSERRCDNCRYYRPIKDESAGECRFFPPQVVAMTAGMKMQPTIVQGSARSVPVPVTQIQGIFPRMAEGDPGCGQFEEGYGTADVCDNDV